MRHGASNRRQRNRGGGGGRRGNQKTQVFDSNGPDVRIRGTAHQIHEKYVALAKDAAGSGDRIVEESYLQHAEHYQRVIHGWADTVERVFKGLPEEDDFENERDAAPPRQKKKPVQSPKSDKQDDDLGLPSSIVGEKDAVQKSSKETEDA